MSTGYTIEFVVHPAICGSIIGLYYLIYIPFLIWYLREFVKYKNLLYISKRYPRVTEYEIVAVTLIIGITFSTITFYRCIDENSKLYLLLWDSAIFSQPITLYAAFYCLLWRCWHFYYDMMLNVHLQNQWKRIVNPDEAVTEESWFLDHKTSFGSTKYIFKRLFIMYVISCIISIGVWFVAPIIGYTMASMTDFVVFTGTIVHIFVSPSFCKYL